MEGPRNANGAAGVLNPNPCATNMSGDDELRHFLGVDRRKDTAMADLVEVGLLFMRVFGRENGWDYFRTTVVEPEVAWRLLRHRWRGSPPDVNPEQTRDGSPGPR
jgi:hypothetical protein